MLNTPLADFALVSSGCCAEFAGEVQAQKATAEQERGISELQDWRKRLGKRPQ